MRSLDETCRRLHEHFHALKASRVRNSQAPVYVLEHPLSAEECAELTKQLRWDYRKLGARQDHWLGWLVAATELGYSYSGSDYWPRLQKRVPEWEFSDRNRLARWFERFAKEYGGARPSGAWAAQFCLIAWPITHAILPTDLQVQLARAIHNARHYLFGIDALDDEEVGKTIARHWVPHGDRFERLLQREAFVGSLVRMLLQPKASQDGLAQHTLRRIVADVSSKAEAETLLSDVRALCRPEIRVATPAMRAKESAVARPRFCPDIVLEKDTNGHWQPFVYPSSAIGLIAEMPSLARSMDQLRFSVSGNHTQAFSARELCNAAPRKRPLGGFPKPGNPLLHFLPSDAPDAALLTRDCILAPRELWVFKVRRDGSAWLQSTPTLLPGASYLVGTLDKSKMLPGDTLDRPMGDLRLAQLKMDAVLTEADRAAFRTAGFEVVQRTVLHPWGILPRVWREDGVAEYVHGEPLLLRVERDREFVALRVTVDAEPSREVPCAKTGDFLLEIAGLTLGDHELCIDTLMVERTKKLVTTSSVTSALLHIHVRAPSVWQPGVLPQEAMAISMGPEGTTLEQVLSGVADLRVEGTADDMINVTLLVIDGGGNRHEHHVLHLRPPIASSDWHEKLDVATSDSELPYHALGATQAALLIVSQRFGSHRKDLTVFPSPLRWVLARQRAGFQIQLHTDDDAPAQVRFFGRETPSVEEPIDFTNIFGGIPARDGLYLARQRETEILLDVSAPPAQLTGFQELAGAQIDEGDALRLLTSLTLWSRATTLGRLARLRHSQTVKKLRTRLVHVLAGKAWMDQEQLLGNRRLLRDLDDLVIPKMPNYGRALGLLRGSRDPKAARNKFFSASDQFSVSKYPALVELAWRLVFDPQLAHEMKLLDDSLLDPALPALVRGARLIQLGMDEEIAL